MADYSKLSIVVPVGPGDHAWRSLMHELGAFGTQPEILLSSCHGQPDDVALPANARWLKGCQGRARQLNAGAREATRAVLWFVHADTRLSDKVAATVNDFMTAAENGLGYFQLRFAADGPGLTALNARAANLRSRLLGLPFGDQGFIVSKRVFDRLHGFDENLALGEDLDFVVRVKANGLPLRELPAALVTSSRRYREHGWLATTLRHLWLTWRLTRQAKQRLNVT